MNKTMTGVLALLTATTGLVSVPAMADSHDLLKKFFVDDATPYLDVRARYENVDQDGIADDANAGTIRTKLGYKTGSLYNLSGVIEVENVSHLGNDAFNSTVNGKTTRPTVADPDGTEINHAYLTYTGIPNTVLRVGRQPHNLDNQRFIGTVGWRQNDQSYDSAAIINSSLPDTTLVYSYVDNVNRIFSSKHPNGDLDTETHVLNAAYDGFSFGKISTYAYLIDLKNPALSALSSKSFGLRFTGSAPLTEDLKALYSAEYARQSDHAENTTDYSADYYLLEGGLGFKGLTVKAGYEVLGSDNGGTVAFQTPLATLHGKNGWADKFLSTPATGLEDAYGSVSYKVSGTNALLDGTTFGVVYHDFSAETGGADYGSEVDAVVKRDFMEHYNVTMKYADYDAETFATDTQKLWLQVGAKF